MNNIIRKIIINLYMKNKIITRIFEKKYKIFLIIIK